ncbi:methyl-accepting chemotaxis protein [[Clostridium] polysaccharolyticum]|uniref:HAMP domain-containing protein n=1 Tax=[Clostridium] polysaccharolyticum TaxID=29364 RepID=A0A1I0C8J9_9FIRM|nr:methyl-accepting chemotaxis protein [[Clostridium] polysaccharolyticum]SET15271.1 HAMP domain-containing protein [[Clostridium] polysaccharolyticum]
MKIRISIRKKLMIPVLLMFLLFSVSLSVMIYHISRDKFIKQGQNEAISVASLIGHMIAPEEVEAIMQSEKEEACYEKIFKFAEQMIEKTGATYIYMVGDYNGTYKYFFANNEETSFYQDLEPEYYREVELALQGKAYATSTIDVSQYGKLITAWIPVVNKEGTVVAALGIDYDVEYICKEISSMLQKIAVLTAVMLFISFIIIYLIIRQMCRQLKRVDNKLEELVSSNGDLTKKIEIAGNDEISDISQKINHLLEYIQEVIKNIAGVTSQMSNSVQNNRKLVSGSVCDLKQVSASTQEVNAMMEETYANTKTITSVVDVEKELLSNIYNDIYDGKGLMEEIKCRAAAISKKAEGKGAELEEMAQKMSASVNEKISKANEVEKINELSKKILEVANKTGMLSLNASIEAARAGEAGKGFSVVAKEISKLSEDTMNTAKEIQQISDMIILVVEELAKEAGNMMDYISQKTLASYNTLREVGTDYVDSSEKAYSFFEGMHDKSVKMEQGMTGIVDSVKVIYENAKQCAEGMEEVSRLTVNLQENVNETEHQAEENEKMMSDLETEVSKFIID